MAVWKSLRITHPPNGYEILNRNFRFSELSPQQLVASNRYILAGTIALGENLFAIAPQNQLFGVFGYQAVLLQV